jgi:hypothetical protein
MRTDPVSSDWHMPDQGPVPLTVASSVAKSSRCLEGPHSMTPPVLHDTVVLESVLRQIRQSQTPSGRARLQP